MPPKKDNKKEQLLTEDDGTGILKNIVQFKLQFQIVSINLQNVAIMYEFINTTTSERFDTGLIEQWTIVAQEPIPNQLEEQQQITYQFEKVYEPMRFIDSLAQTLSNKRMYLYFINTDDMKVLQEFTFDYSRMLNEPKFEYNYSKLKIMEILDFTFSITADKPLLSDQLRQHLNPFQVEIVSVENIPIHQLKSYELAYVKYEFYNGEVISTDPQVQMPNMYFQSKHVFLLGNTNLVDKFKSQLLRIELHDKDEVVHNDIRQELPLFDIEQWLQIEAEKDKPPEPVDQIDPKTGKKIPKKEDKKEAKKEVKKEVKKDAKKDNKKKDVKLGEPVKEHKAEVEYNRTNYGLAQYNLKDFLQANVKEVYLLAPVVPVKQFIDTESNNLDLNTTARRNLAKVYTATNYLDQHASMYVKFEMSAPLIPKHT